jgi:hypothetical protein
MNFGQTALQVLKTVAPTLALAVGGPFGPLAAAAIHVALGTTDQASAEKALVNATPDQLLALKKADQDFEVQIEKLGIEKAKLAYDDTASARAREMSVKDATPHILAYGITVGFFGILGYLLWNGKPPGGDVIMVMLGALGSAWAGVISYYFGSSAGSAAKDGTISKIVTK